MHVKVKRNPDDLGHAFMGYQQALTWLSGKEVGHLHYCVIVVLITDSYVCASFG